MKHTPAPWEIKGAQAIWGNPQTQGSGAVHYTAVTGTINNPADAALIAAAPELLAALRECAFVAETIAHLQGKEAEYLPMADRARAAIAKATGAEK